MLELVRANVQRVAGLALLVLGGLIAAACAGGEPPSLAPPATEALPRSAGAFYQAPASTPVPIPEPSYLSEVIPPCTPIEGFTGDTCTPSLTSLSADASYDFGSEPFDLSRFLVGGVGTPLWTAHFVVRATTVPNTIRCETSDRPFRFPAYARDSALESGRHTVDCYVDVRVNEYLIGSGPEYLTLLVAYAFHHGEEQRQAIEQAFVGGSETGDLISLWRVRDGGVRAWEGIFFIAPSSNGAIEAFEVSASWHLQEDNDDTVRAIHPHADAWSKYPEIYEQHRDTLLEPTLATLKAGIIAANEVRMEANGGLIAPTTETWV